MAWIFLTCALYTCPKWQTPSVPVFDVRKSKSYVPAKVRWRTQ